MKKQKSLLNFTLLNREIQVFEALGFADDTPLYRSPMRLLGAYVFALFARLSRCDTPLNRSPMRLLGAYGSRAARRAALS